MSATEFKARHPRLVWSNSQATDEVWIRAALLHPRFHTILDACIEFGLERVRHEWQVLTQDAAPEVCRVTSQVNRILQHIAEGFADAQTRD